MLKTVGQLTYHQIVGVLFLVLAASSTIAMTIVDYEPRVRHASLKDRQGAPALIQTLSGARRVCQAQIAINFRGDLQNTVIDEYSSRYDERRNLFVVFMNASIGDIERPKVVRIHCHVVPGESKADYIKVYRTNRKTYTDTVRAF